MYCSSLSSIDLLPLFLQGMDGIPDVVSSMEYYDLLRSDWDLVCEIARFPKQPDITAQIPSKVYTTISRVYLLQGSPLPIYSSGKL